MRSQAARWSRGGKATVLFGVLVVVAGAGGAAVPLPPRADGTLVDGGIYGPFDGRADAADWTFNGAGFEGAITLQREGGLEPLEHRVVAEFDLGNVLLAPIRGPTDYNHLSVRAAAAAILDRLRGLR